MMRHEQQSSRPEKMAILRGGRNFSKLNFYKFCQLIFLWTLVLASSTTLFANTLDLAPKGFVAAGRTDNPPKIDGKLNDSCWSNAVELGPFTILNSYEFAREQTRAFVCYDDEYLYVAFKCFESCLEPLANRLGDFVENTKKNDDEKIWDDDCVILMLMPNGDYSRFYDIVINGNGTIYDAVYEKPFYWHSRKKSWNSNANTAVAKNDGFWTVEIAVPFKSFGVTPVNKWGVLFGRIQQGSKEKSAWQTTQGSFHHPDRFAVLKFRNTSLKYGIKIGAIPKMITGNNCLKLTLSSEEKTNARVTAEVKFEDSDLQTYTKNILLDGVKDTDFCFDLKKYGDFKFRWTYETIDGEKYDYCYLSPVYDMKVHGINFSICKLSEGANVYINGNVASAQNTLSQGKNVIAIESLGNLSGLFTSDSYKFEIDNSWKYSPVFFADWKNATFNDDNWAYCKQEYNAIKSPGFLRKTFLYNETTIWPAWNKKSISIPQGSLQQLLFAVKGIPGEKLKDYRVYIETPVEMEVIGASGYYNIYKIEFEKGGIIEREGKIFRRYVANFMNDIEFTAMPPLHKHFIFVLKAPNDDKLSHNLINYYCKAKNDNIIEIPQTMKVDILPALNGIQSSKLTVQMWLGWLSNLDDKELRTKLCDELVKCGVTEIGSANFKHDKLKRFVLMDFNHWYLDCSKYLKDYPEAAVIDAQGRRSTWEVNMNNDAICPSTILTDHAAQIFLSNAVKDYMKRWNYPDNIVWDYEQRVFESYLACFCPGCLQRFKNEFELKVPLDATTIKQKYSSEWTVFMNRQMSRIAVILEKFIKEHKPSTIFSVYSGYQSEHTNWYYGVNWELLDGKIDRASCGYGRPLKHLEATQSALKNTPLLIGSIDYPNSVESRDYPTCSSQAKFLRRLCDSSGGLLIYSYETLDGKTFYALSEISRLAAEYENIFLEPVRTPDLISVRGLNEDEIEVFTQKNNTLIMLMNQTSQPQPFTIENSKLPTDAVLKDFYTGESFPVEKSIKGNIPSGGIRVFYYKGKTG